ncbi:MAG: MATE family efflux transporter [Fusicatenibacter sp.]|nr:MATE family efflux transporter [Fusicatenibacter sp.]
MAKAGKSSTKDLTIGTPWKLIIGFAVPLLLGMLFQQFYSMVDTIIVGRMLGANALAAVGSTGSINFMIVGFCMGVCNGFAIPVSQAFGAGDYRALRKYVANGAVLAVIFAVVITTAVSLLCGQILRWMNTPTDIVDNAQAYISIIFLGIPVTILYNQTSAIIRSLGDSKSPLIFLGISSVLNIVLDLLLVRPMGVAGTALATVTSQAVSGILCLFYMKKKFDILRFQRDDWKLHRRYVINLCNMGIPMGLQYSITAIGSVILQTAVNGLGSVAVASVTASGKISMFFCCPFDALGSTMATYSGQNVGAKKLDRVNAGVKASTVIGAVYSVIAFGVMYLIGREIALLFVDTSETVILNQARRMLLTNVAFYIPLALVNIIRFTIQGMGFSRLAVIAGVCEMIARSIVGFVFVPVFGFAAVCFANPVAWIMADLFLIPAYLLCVRKLRELFREKSEQIPA